MTRERERRIQPEVPRKIKRFSDEARKWLDEEKYLVYSLTGKSIRTFREAGYSFWSTWHNNYPYFEALTSQLSEVAIRLDQLFLPGSNSKTLHKQLGMVARKSVDLSRQAGGIQAVIGRSPDYVELAFNHLDATGQRLFGRDFDYYLTTTVTSIGNEITNVGLFLNNGLTVGKRQLRNNVYVAPLIVPV